jgi:hypothetical protein
MVNYDKILLFGSSYKDQGHIRSDALFLDDYEGQIVPAFRTMAQAYPDSLIHCARSRITNQSRVQ